LWFSAPKPAACASAVWTTVRQQLGRRKPQAVKKYGLSLLKMGKNCPKHVELVEYQ
jgi:hypothetical protein